MGFAKGSECTRDFGKVLSSACDKKEEEKAFVELKPFELVSSLLEIVWKFSSDP